MARRAVIYIRTSSETQGEKSSPVEQEADCQRLAEEKGLTVVHVYRDVERYRVGNKPVEPSGSRSDRDGLLAMLKDVTRRIRCHPRLARRQAISWITLHVDGFGNCPGIQD